ncbi:MAG: ATP-binding protein [Chloroflexi bacterium]|nr:MAG: ATP-binding protein [Chloroflexota bacterium]
MRRRSGATARSSRPSRCSRTSASSARSSGSAPSSSAWRATRSARRSRRSSSSSIWRSASSPRATARGPRSWSEIVSTTADEYPTDPGHPIHVVTTANELLVRADARRLVEVIENLINNAVKYSPSGGTVTVEIAREGENGVVRVRDEGLGVPEDERAHIFERFYRTTAAKPYGGVGLGLYISKEIMVRLGGDIVLESASERGSVFRVSLPLAPVSAVVS